MGQLPITGPVQLIDDKFSLLIPLEVCGEELIALTKGIATVEEDTLKVLIPDWMMKYLGLRVDGLVVVDVVEGKFNIKSAEWTPDDPPAEMPPKGYIHPR